MKNKREITIRVTEQEFAMLESHCNAVGRTKTDILREFIRSLATTPTTPSDQVQVYLSTVGRTETFNACEEMNHCSNLETSLSKFAQ